jgi:hypothetical protein
MSASTAGPESVRTAGLFTAADIGAIKTPIAPPAAQVTRRRFFLGPRREYRLMLARAITAAPTLPAACATDAGRPSRHSSSSGLQPGSDLAILGSYGGKAANNSQRRAINDRQHPANC